MTKYIIETAPAYKFSLSSYDLDEKFHHLVFIPKNNSEYDAIFTDAYSKIDELLQTESEKMADILKVIPCDEYTFNNPREVIDYFLPAKDRKKFSDAQIETIKKEITSYAENSVYTNTQDELSKSCFKILSAYTGIDYDKQYDMRDSFKGVSAGTVYYSGNIINDKDIEIFEKAYFGDYREWQMHIDDEAPISLESIVGGLAITFSDNEEDLLAELREKLQIDPTDEIKIFYYDYEAPAGIIRYVDEEKRQYLFVDRVDKYEKTTKQRTEERE